MYYNFIFKTSDHSDNCHYDENIKYMDKKNEKRLYKIKIIGSIYVKMLKRLTALYL